MDEPAVPVADCPLCEEPVTEAHLADNAQRIGGLAGGRFAHRECLLRDVLGGIGHLTNHAHWCVVERDPDAGMSYRESALQVTAWVVDRLAEIPDVPPSRNS